MGRDDSPGTTALRFALLVVSVILIIVATKWATKGSGRERFYTLYAREEPTRSYVPYTGEIPYGEWGARPWADVDFPPAGDGRPCPVLGPGFNGVQTPPVSANHPLSWNARRHPSIPY